MSSPNLTNLVLFSPIWEESPNPKFRILVSVNSSTNVQIIVSRAVVRGLNINIPFMKHTGTWIMDEKINILSHHVFLFISITYTNTPCIYSMITLLTVPDLLFILHPAADLYVEVIHDNIDTSPECISPTTACAKLPFI